MMETLFPPMQKLPVTIVTGFLGSGKTTLLNHILQNFENYKVAVLVNEFGDINIDSQFLITVSEDVVELTNGCICCTINNNLSDAVHRILDRPDRIDYLIIETTGVANPLPVALTFLGTELRDHTQLDAIITVIDAETFIPDECHNSDAAMSQILYSDIMILNKTDLVAEQKIDELESYIGSLREHARILRSEYSRVPLSLILEVNLSHPEPLTALPEALPTLDNDGFISVSFQSDRPISLKKFQQFLYYQLPNSVFQAKGVLWFKDSPQRHLFQLSGKRFTIDDSEWNTSPQNQIVLIGRKLDKLFLFQQLNNCLTQ